MDVYFTETEQAILRILADGNVHTKEEVFVALGDALQPMRNVQPHITRIRKKIQPHGHDIVCVFLNRRYMYRHVLTLSSSVSEE